MIRFACGSCQKSISAPDEKAGMRFLCPGCKSPLEVPRASNLIQAARPPAAAAARNSAVQGPAADISNAPFAKRFLSECLAIVGATFRQTLKPITLVFEIQRRRRLRKHFGRAKFALGQRAYESQVGDKKLRGRIQALGERIQNIQDVKGDAKQPIAERKELLNQLAEPFLAAPSVPEAVSGEHERARTLADKLRSQEAALAGAMGGLMPPNGLAWRRISIGYTMALLLTVPGPALLWAHSRQQAAIEKAERDAKKAEDDRREQEDAKWATHDKKPKEIVKLCGPSVAMVHVKFGEGLEGGGTGFMIRPGVMVTNAHVAEVALPEDLKIYYPSAKDIAKTPFGCRILHFDRKRDLAILAVEPKVPPLRLADNYEFESGAVITMIGCPGGADGKQLENAVATGNLSTKAELNKMPFYQLGAAVNHGNSGGPVFDDRGQVIGVVTAKGQGGGIESMGYCIPWKDLKEHLDSLEKEDPHKLAAKAQSIHGLFVVKDRIDTTWKINLGIVGIYASAMQAFRRSPDQLINQLRPQIEEQFGKYRPAMMDSRHHAVADRLYNDPNVTDEVRNRFRDLVGTTDEFSKLADSPSGTANAYLGKARELRVRYRRQLAALNKSLGLDVPKEDDE